MYCKGGYEPPFLLGAWNPVVCQDRMVGNFNGAVKLMKSARMMSQDIIHILMVFLLIVRISVPEA